MSLASERHSLESELLTELNDIDKLTANELTAAYVMPRIPKNREIRILPSRSLPERIQQNLENFIKRVLI